MLWVFPLEKFDLRYTSQWYRWVQEDLEGLKVDFEYVYPEPVVKEIKTGRFLDTVGTVHFKASQLQLFASKIISGEVSAGDKILVFDGWFPGMGLIKYWSQMSGIPVEIYGIFHAGTYDIYDMTFEKGLSVWARPLEQSWFLMYDKVFVATQFHRKLIESTFGDAENVKVTGFPFRMEYTIKTKENIVVFPHRLDWEKNVKEFDKLSKILSPKYPNWRFIKTFGMIEGKGGYYNVLSRAKVAVSCAYQETWGIAMMECADLGCHCVVPNSLSYPEMYPDECRYNSFEKLLKLVELAMKRKDFTVKHFTCVYRESVKNMVKEMGLL